MGGTREALATATGGLVEELKAQGQDKGEDAFDKRPALAKQLHVGGFIWKSTVMVRFARVGLAAVPMCHPSVIRSRKLRRQHGGNALKSQDYRKGFGALPLNWVECEKGWTGGQRLPWTDE